MKRFLPTFMFIFFGALAIWKTIESDSYMHKYWDAQDSLIVYKQETLDAYAKAKKWSDKALKFQNDAIENLELLNASSKELTRIQTKYQILISDEYFTAYHKWKRYFE